MFDTVCKLGAKEDFAIDDNITNEDLTWSKYDPRWSKIVCLYNISTVHVKMPVCPHHLTAW